MIISAGYNIAAPEVEDALLAASQGGRVRRGRRARRRSAARSSRRSSCCSRATRRAPTLVKELQDFVKDTIAPYKYPRAIEFLDALPSTETGKLQRFKLRLR